MKYYKNGWKQVPLIKVTNKQDKTDNNLETVSKQVVGAINELKNNKQALINSNNKLNADLIDDTNSTNKMVTSQEKEDWNNKSDFSGDYNDLRNKPTIPSNQWTSSMITLLETVFQNVAYINSSTGQTAATNLIASLRAEPTIVSISATYNGGTKYTGDTVSVSDFNVTATYSDSSTKTVNATAVSPTILTNTANTISVYYGSISTEVTVPAIFDAPTSMSDVSYSKETVSNGTVFLDAGTVTYTLTYSSGRVVTMYDQNIITLTPSVATNSTSSTITQTVSVALSDYPNISSTFSVNVEGQAEVLSATVTLEKKQYPPVGSTTPSDRPTSLALTFDTAMTKMPNKLVISCDATTTVATRIASGEFTRSGNVWNGWLKLGTNTSPTALTSLTIDVQGTDGNYTGCNVGPFGISGGTGQFRTTSGIYTFVFTYEE